MRRSTWKLKQYEMKMSNNLYNLNLDGYSCAKERIIRHNENKYLCIDCRRPPDCVRVSAPRSARPRGSTGDDDFDCYVDDDDDQMTIG